MDTGAFLSLADPRDENHKPAVECLEMIEQRRLPVFVSLPTIYESHRRLLFSLGQCAAKRFFDALSDGSVAIVRPLGEDELEARRLIDRYEALALTLTDAANMAIMTRLQIAASFSFDKHFLQAGFIRIPPFHL